MIKTIRNNGITILVIIAIMVINVLAYFQYQDNVQYDLNTQTQNHISTIVEDTVEFFNLKMEKRVASIEALALFIGTFDDWTNENVTSALSAQAQVEGYSEYDIINTEGVGLHGDDYSENKNFIKALAGECLVKEAVDEFGKISGVDYYVPVNYGEKTTGVLKITTNLEQFTDFIDFSELSHLGNIFIVKKDGTLLSRGDGLDEVENITQILNDQESVAKQLINSMKVRNKGNVSISNGDNKQYFGYCKSDYNKWYVLSLISSNAVESEIGSINNEGRVFFIQIAILFVFLVFYFIYTMIAFNRESKMNKRRYYLMSAQMEHIVFDYSAKNNRVYCNEKWEELFGYNIDLEDPKEEKLKYIFEDDKEKFIQSIEELRNNQDEIEQNIRIVNANNEPIECHMKLFAIKARKGKFVKLIGVLDKKDEKVEK